jgi:vacuolar protein-sorting-associated protein 4
MSCRPARGPNGEQGFWEPCGPSVPGAQERDLSWFAKENLADKVLVPPITLHDFMASLERARPTVSEEDLAKYTAWTREFGEEGV